MLPSQTLFLAIILTMSYNITVENICYMWSLSLCCSPLKSIKLMSQSVSSVTQSCPTLCDPMNRSTPGLPVHHQLPEFTQTHVHRVGDPASESFEMSQLFTWGGWMDTWGGWMDMSPAISPSVLPLSSCPQSFPASESFPMSQLFAWWPKWSKVAKVLELQL